MSTKLLCFFNDTASTEIYTLSLHDALPISERFERQDVRQLDAADVTRAVGEIGADDEQHGGEQCRDGRYVDLERAQARSEERRVGKECRSRREACHEKKK